MKPLNAKQQRVLEYLQQCARDGVPPSVREICTAADIKSTSTAHAVLRFLEDEGYIERRSGLNRCIRLVGEQTAPNETRIPLLGRVTAGVPITAVEQIEDYVPYTGGRFPAEEMFALRVMGTSMIGAGILDKDVVIVHRTPAAENGDIVVALIDDEATVKRIYFEKDHVRLQPENDAFEPILVPEAVVLGKVVSLLRYF